MTLKEHEGTVRAFIAADVSHDNILEIGWLQQGLKDSVSGVRWVRSGRIHLTLKFLGNIKEEYVEKLGNILRPICASHTVMEFKIGNLGVFPDLKRARVLWLGLEGELEKLGKLQADMENGCETVGFAKEKRSFKPHLTIGRVKARIKEPGHLAEVMGQADLSRFKPFRVDRIYIYRSELKPDGAHYSRLKTFPLRGEIKGR